MEGLEHCDLQLVVEDRDTISLDGCLSKINSERVLKLEKTLFALFGQLGSGGVSGSASK